MLCALLLGLSSPAAKAITRPENRVGGSAVFSSDFAAQESANPIGTRAENPGCGCDFASGVHKYLYAEDNPVNRIDPSGHDDFIETLATTYIQSTLGSMVMPAVSSAFGAVIPDLIPQRVDDEIASAAIPDAAIVGLSGSLIPSGKIPLGLTGGAEFLVSAKTGKFAAYGYGGIAIAQSSSAQAFFGVAFNTRNSKAYRGPFTTFSFPYSRWTPSLRNKIDGFLASGFGATACGSSPEFIQEAQSIGLQLSGVLDKSTVNVFFDTTFGGAVGLTFSYEIGPSSPTPPLKVGASETFYKQLWPKNNEIVPFR